MSKMPVTTMETESSGSQAKDHQVATTKKGPVNLPWVEKYRPNALQELISHEDIITTIRKFIKEDKLPHLLFYGPPGTVFELILIHLANLQSFWWSLFSHMFLQDVCTFVISFYQSKQTNS